MERGEVARTHRRGVQRVVAIGCPRVGGVYHDGLFGLGGLDDASGGELDRVAASLGIDVHGVALGAGGAVAEVPREAACIVGTQVGKLGAVHVAVYGELCLQVALLEGDDAYLARTIAEGYGIVVGIDGTDVGKAHVVDAVFDGTEGGHGDAHHGSVALAYLRASTDVDREPLAVLTGCHAIRRGAQRGLYP